MARATVRKLASSNCRCRMCELAVKQYRGTQPLPRGELILDLYVRTAQGGGTSILCRKHAIEFAKQLKAEIAKGYGVEI